MYVPTELTGRYGLWTIIKRDGHIGTCLAYLCRCDCGTERRVESSALRKGHSKSCGCVGQDARSAGRRAQLQRDRIDLRGTTKGLLTYVGEAPVRNENRWIYVDCACGKKNHEMPAASYLDKTVSCGCLQVRTSGRKVKDLTGKQFGKLTVAKQVEGERGAPIRWLCNCECGGTKVVLGNNLTSKTGTRSCGCLSREVLKFHPSERKKHAYHARTTQDD